MRLKHHIVVSALLSGILLAAFKSWGLSIASLFTGIFIDMDHIIDYLLERGLHLNKEKFFRFFYKEEHKKVTVIFHGWEFLILSAIAAVLTNFNFWVTGILIGYGQHIAIDYLFNKVPFLSYSLIWRWKIGFDSEIIFPRDRGYDPMLFKNKKM